ncbi:MAG: YkvA family protein [Chromatocurvus sp.]
MTTQIREIPKQQERDHASDKAYADAYSEERLRDKLSRHTLTAGRDVVEKALLLYYALQQEQTPAWAKATIIGALGYFITPVDAILDITPGVGYVDDLGVLAFAIATVSTSIDDAVRQRASARLQAWFGDTATSQVGETAE